MAAGAILLPPRSAVSIYHKNIMESSNLRVLIVDDTVVYRRILSDVLEAFDDVHLVGTAPHGRMALTKMETEPVDLVLLDVEMPEMSGLETLRHIRKDHPETSVIMISGTTSAAASYTMDALAQGALEFIRKPDGADADANRSELKDLLRPLLRHVRMKKNLRVPESRGRAVPAPSPVAPARPALPVPAAPARPVHHGLRPTRFDVVGIGVSTGGPNALADVIPLLPADLAVPVLIVQHMPPMFTASLAEHLHKRSKVPVREAREGEPLLPGHVYIAPGGKHMVLRRAGEAGAFIIGLNENPPENSCRPSVDVLFRSLASQYDGNLLAVVMTGMGSDGCEGVRAMKRKGCHCLTQSEESCVVYGMPMAVDEAGLSDEKVPLARLAARITHLVQNGRSS
jgi:two-component system chemotaxis response regulator CheB